jgi:hypothetical protein
MTMELAHAAEAMKARRTAERTRDRIISELHPPKTAPNLTDSPQVCPLEKVASGAFSDSVLSPAAESVVFARGAQPPAVTRGYARTPAVRKA